jgi:hypothetical protein
MDEEIPAPIRRLLASAFIVYDHEVEGKMQFFPPVLCCRYLVDIYQRFVRTYCLYREIQGRLPWRWKQHISSKPWHVSASLHDVVSEFPRLSTAVYVWRHKVEPAVHVLRSGGLTPLISKVNGVSSVSRSSRFNPVLSGLNFWMGTTAGMFVDPMPEISAQSCSQPVTLLTELPRERNRVSKVKSVTCEWWWRGGGGGWAYAIIPNRNFSMWFFPVRYEDIFFLSDKCQ